MRHVVAAIGLGVALALGACAPPSDPGTATTTTTTPEQGAACQIELRTIATAIQAYEAVTGAAPASLNDLLVGQPPYLKDPPGPEFVYVVSVDGYTLTAPCGTETG